MKCEPAEPGESRRVCIVGAGPVGLAIAFKLESSGLPVTLIEADEDGVPLGELVVSNGNHAFPDKTCRPGIGGGSALWGGRCVEFDDLDFEVRDHVAMSGWPIRHEELASYYPEALRFLNCGVILPEHSKPPAGSEGVNTSAIERWSSSSDLEETATARLTTSPRIELIRGTVTNIVLDPSGSRAVAVTVVMKDGASTDVGADLFVLAAGGLETARLLLLLKKEQPGCALGTNPFLGSCYQGHLTGYIATIDFADPASARKFAFQKDADGHVFRRRFQLQPEHQRQEGLLNTVFWTDAISVSDPLHGSGTLSLLYMFLDRLGLYARWSKGLAPAISGPRAANGEHWVNVRSDGHLFRGLWRTVTSLISRRKGSRLLFNPAGRYLLRYHAEQSPNCFSRVELSTGKSGSQAPALRVDYRVKAQDLRSVVRSHELLDTWLRQSGLGRLHYLVTPPARIRQVLDQANDGFHQIGLARMAEGPEKGVVDPDCRIHGMANLYVAGSAVFPTSGQANPTLPAVALALRLAGTLVKVARTVT